MTDEEAFNRLLNGGVFSVPYLLKFSCVGCTDVCVVNNIDDVVYDGTTYKAASFEYLPPDNMGSGASLKINAFDNNLIEFVENANENYRLDVIGIIAENGEVQPLKQYKHFYGTVSYNEKEELNFELGTDDRLEMTFPPYKFDTDTNRGNT